MLSMSYASLEAATIALFALCLVAAVLQVAVLRAPDICDSPLSEAGRAIEIAGWTIGALWYGYLLIEGMAIIMRWPTFWLLGMLALARIVVAMGRLFPDSGTHVGRNDAQARSHES